MCLGLFYEIGEQFIKDVDYYSLIVKEICDQLDDFDGCWVDIIKVVKERKELVSDKIRNKL